MSNRMRLVWVCCLLILAALTITCKQDEGDDEPELWHVSRMDSLGDSPVPSRDGTKVLFEKEQSPPGLFVFDPNTNSTAQIPTGSIGDFRSDYAWSPDGSLICLSRPSGGIFLLAVSDSSVHTALWSSGFHPRFLIDNTHLVCSGPEDGSENQGIWQISTGDLDRQILSPVGINPEPSQNSSHIAFLQTTGGSDGRLLVVYHRVSDDLDTLAGHVLNFSWLGDSRTIVFEAIENGLSVVKSVSIENAQVTSYSRGTSPAGIPGDGTHFYFTALSGDMSAGIHQKTLNGAAVALTTFGNHARALNANACVFQHAGGVYIAEK